MTVDLMEVNREDDPLLAFSLLGACLALGLETATTVQGLATFWRGHQEPLKRLATDDLAAVTQVKDRRKLELTAAGGAARSL